MQRFEEYARRKVDRSLRRPIPGFRTTRAPTDSPGLIAIGNEWSERLFDGKFYVRPPSESLPAVSLVFVQSRDGNTVADNPSLLGGGLTDEHLVYEGLSRVAADAVLAGAHTVGNDTFFSVWHPELVALRRRLSQTRHPAQIVVTGSGVLPIDTGLIANVPDVPLFVLTSTTAAPTVRLAAAGRTWIEVVACGDPVDLHTGLTRLFTEFHIGRISAVGGRTVAHALMRAGLARDVYLTTSPLCAGEPGSGLEFPAVERHLVLAKEGCGNETGVRFEHWELRPSGVAVSTECSSGE